MSSRLLDTWTEFRKKVAGFLSILLVVRFSLAMVLLPAIALIFIGQGREALRILATAPHQPTSQVAWFIFSLVLLTFMAWYWASILVDVLRPGARSEPGPKGWAARQLPRICGIIPAVAMAIAFLVTANLFAHRNTTQAVYSSSTDSIADSAPERSAVQDYRPPVEVKYSPVRFVVLAIVSVLFTIPIYAIFYFRRRRLEKRDSQLGRPVASDESGKQQLSVRRLPGLSKSVLTITILVWLVLLLLFVFQTGDRPIIIGPSQAFGPVAIALFFAAVWVPFGSLLVFWSETYKVPLFTILFVLAAGFSIFDLNDNHQIRTFTQERASSPPQLRNAFDQWLSQRCDLDKYSSYPVFIVATEGGGIRAAYFTSLVLSAAQDQNKEFAHHVFAISGVSGGSVGATVFTALTNKYVQKTQGTPCAFENNIPKNRTMQAMTNEILGQDLLSPVLASALYPDLIQRFLFWPVHRFDRARSLEDGLRQSWENATDNSPEFSNHSSFYQLSQANPNQSTPALLLNTTEVETGQRMVVSSLDLWKDNQPDADLNGLLGINRIPKVYPQNIDFPLSSAAFLSSRFPVITPAGFICRGDGKCERKSRYVDGGYFENSGTATLADIISALHVERHNANSSQKQFKLIVISIGADPFDVKYRAVGLGEITAPIFALLNTRSARGNTATQQLGTVMRNLNSSSNDMAEVVHFQAHETDVRLPTGWLLSAQARKNMECQLGISHDQTTCTSFDHEPDLARQCRNNRECLLRLCKFFSNDCSEKK